MLGVESADIKQARAEIRAILRAVPRMPAARKSLTLSLHNVYETLVICWPTVIDAFLGRVSMEECDARLASWAAEIAKNAAYELEVAGREHLGDKGEAFLVMSNHQSLYDVPVLFHVLGANLRMITKSELFAVPIFGPAMLASGFISIDRSNRTRALESLAVAKAKIAAGRNVWIAPEGTRSKDGKLLPFKRGGFQLAIEAGLRVLPVTLNGTRDILAAKGSRSVSHARVRVTIHPPIDANEYAAMGAKEGREALMKKVREALESGL
jgi:1-acyl-sn-glycerol-3-phosphate acyltransferase